MRNALFPPTMPTVPSPRPLREQRTKLKPVRFTPSELSRLEQFLGGRDYSDVVRAYVLGGALPEPKTGAVKREVIRKRITEGEAACARQLAWIGNNLNQIAKAANQGAGNFQVLSALLRLEREVKGISDAR